MLRGLLFSLKQPVVETLEIKESSQAKNPRLNCLGTIFKRGNESLSMLRVQIKVFGVIITQFKRSCIRDLQVINITLTTETVLVHTCKKLASCVYVTYQIQNLQVHLTRFLQDVSFSLARRIRGVYLTYKFLRLTTHVHKKSKTYTPRIRDVSDSRKFL